MQDDGPKQEPLYWPSAAVDSLAAAASGHASTIPSRRHRSSRLLRATSIVLCLSMKFPILVLISLYFQATGRGAGACAPRHDRISSAPTCAAAPHQLRHRRPNWPARTATRASRKHAVASASRDREPKAPRARTTCCVVNLLALQRQARRPCKTIMSNACPDVACRCRSCRSERFSRRSVKPLLLHQICSPVR
jgi:hypothetical protein